MKPLLGHTFAASGLVSLAAMLSAIKRRTIPGMFHYEEGTEYIDFEKSPFYVSRSNREWKSAAGKRKGLISATGMSGTNAYAVIEEYVEEKSEIRKPEFNNEEALIVLSARSRDDLKKMAENFRVFVAEASSLRLVDLAYTLQMGREVFKERLAFMAGSKEELDEKLARFISGEERGVEPERKMDWESLCRKGAVRRLSGLPAYPFARRRCWIDTDQGRFKSSKRMKQTERGRFFPRIEPLRGKGRAVPLTRKKEQRVLPVNWRQINWDALLTGSSWIRAILSWG